MKSLLSKILEENEMGVLIEDMRAEIATMVKVRNPFAINMLG